MVSFLDFRASENADFQLPKFDADGELIPYDCSLKNIKIANEDDGYDGGQCSFVQDQDDCAPQGNFGFLELYYCDFHNAFGKTGGLIAFIPVGSLFVFIGMYTLASTADVYLSPSLEHLTTAWGLSDSLAGVTLLAFGNGAPDVFSSIAAASDGAGSDDNDATKSVSILLGGTFFISCFVVSLSTYASNLNADPRGPKQRMIKVTPRFFIRDVTFFILTIVYLLAVMLFIEHFNIFLSVGLLLIYAIYVVTVVC